MQNLPGNSNEDITLEYEEQIYAHVRSKLELGRLFREVNQKIISGANDVQIFEFVFDNLSRFIPFDRIGVALIDQQDGLVKLRWVRSKDPPKHLSGNYSAPLKGSSLEKIVSTGKPRILNDLLQYLREHPNSVSTQLITQDGIRSSLTCPLSADGRPVGFVFFSSKTPNTYSEEHAEVFLEIAEELSIVAEQQHLKGLRERN